ERGELLALLLALRQQQIGKKLPHPGSLQSGNRSPGIIADVKTTKERDVRFVDTSRHYASLKSNVRFAVPARGSGGRSGVVVGRKEGGPPGIADDCCVWVEICRALYANALIMLGGVRGCSIMVYIVKDSTPVSEELS